MAVNQVVVRLRADIADYTSKLAEAQRQMAHRISVVRAGHSAEVNMARAALREKEKLALAGAKVDIDAARRAYQERVQFSSAAAAAEIKAARKSFAARSQIGAGATAAGSRLSLLAKEFTVAGQSANRSTGGLGRLNDALVTITRTSTGMPPIMGRLTDVLGTFAIGVGPMIPILAGIAAVAAGFAHITKEARESKKAAKEAFDEIAKMAEARRWGEFSTVGPALGQALGQQESARLRRDRLKEQLALLSAPGGNADTEAAARIVRGQLARAQAEYDKWTTARKNAEVEAGAIFTSAAEKAAKSGQQAHEKAASDAAAAWRAVVQEIEEAVRLHHQMMSQYSPLSVMTATGGRVGGLPEMRARTPEELAHLSGQIDLSALAALGTAADSTAQVMANLTDEVKRAQGVWKGAAVGPDGNVLKNPPTFTKGLGDTLKGMLDPKMLATGLATGFVSSGISFAMGALAEMGKSLINFGSAAKEAARATREAITNLRDEIALLSGSPAEQGLVRLRQQTESLIEDFRERGKHGRYAGAEQRFLGAFDPARLRDARSYEEFIAILNQMRDSVPLFSHEMEIFNDIIRLSQERWKDVNGEIGKFTDGLRNVASGFKVNLATFRTTDAASPSGGPFWERVRGGMRGSSVDVNVTVVAKPEGIFEVVETQAVRKRRSGGRPAWEVAG